MDSEATEFHGVLMYTHHTLICAVNTLSLSLLKVYIRLNTTNHWACPKVTKQVKTANPIFIIQDFWKI